MWTKAWPGVIPPYGSREPQGAGEEQPQEAAVLSHIMHQKALWKPWLGKAQTPSCLAPRMAGIASTVLGREPLITPYRQKNLIPLRCTSSFQMLQTYLVDKVLIKFPLWPSSLCLLQLKQEPACVCSLYVPSSCHRGSCFYPGPFSPAHSRARVHQPGAGGHEAGGGQPEQGEFPEACLSRPSPVPCSFLPPSVWEIITYSGSAVSSLFPSGHLSRGNRGWG